MKNLITGILILFVSLNITAQNVKTDSVAVMILDQMSHIIGDLTSVSFTLNTRNDVIDRDAGTISNFGVSEVFFDGPDKMHVNVRGNKGHLGYWYNGEFLVMYSYSENNYSLIEAPPRTIEMIDSVNYTFGIDFPAADFFYPTFTDDLLANSDEIIYNGMKAISGNECFHIISRQKEMTVQMWISTEAMYLPYKMLIMYHGKKEGLQYEATFSNWQINPVLPSSMFEFLPPPKAREVRIIPKTNK